MRATTNPVFRRSQGYTPVLFFALFWTLKPGSALRGMYYPTTWCALVFFRMPLEFAPQLFWERRRAKAYTSYFDLVPYKKETGYYTIQPNARPG